MFPNTVFRIQPINQISYHKHWDGGSYKNSYTSHASVLMGIVNLFTEAP